MNVVLNVTTETLLGLTVKKVHKGSVVYTDKFKSYDSLMFCGYRHLKVDHGKYFSSGKVYINGMEGFSSWAKERFIKHHGVSKEYFPLYLKEQEFRYNNRHSDICETPRGKPRGIFSATCGCIGSCENPQGPMRIRGMLCSPL